MYPIGMDSSPDRGNWTVRKIYDSASLMPSEHIISTRKSYSLISRVSLNNYEQGIFANNQAEYVDKLSVLACYGGNMIGGLEN